MKTILVIVNGVSQSGKDSFVNFAVEHLKTRGCPVLKHSTIDTPKEMAKIAGWNGTKNPASREMLEELKQWWIKHFDGPRVQVGETVRCLSEINPISNPDAVAVVFTMCREPDEIKKMVDWCAEVGYIYHTVCIIARGDTISKDVAVEQYEYSEYIPNDQDLHQLNLKAMQFVNVLMY